MDFISNSWFISVIGGLIVTLTWEMIKLFTERKAYNRQIKLVHIDFSVIIKSFIGEDDLPTPTILESLLKGTAQKHNVKFKDVSKVSDIFNALIREVMESSFLEYNQKVAFCEKLENLSTCLNEQIQQTNNLALTTDSSSYSKKRLITLLPVLVISSGMISGLLTFTQTNEKFRAFDEKYTKILIENPFLLVGFIMLMLTSLVFLAFLIRNRELKETE